MPRVNRTPRLPPQLRAQQKETSRLPSWETVKKIVFVVFSGWAIARGGEHVSSILQGRATLLPEDPINAFPSTVAHVVHPGVLSVGRNGCPLTNERVTIEECQAATDAATQFLQEFQSRDYHRVMNNYRIRRSGGAIIRVPTSIAFKGGMKTLVIGTEAKELINHKEALKYIEAEVLSRPSFWDLPTGEISNMFLTYNKILTEGLEQLDECASSSCQAGELRTDYIFMNTHKGGLEEALQSASDEELEAFARFQEVNREIDLLSEEDQHSIKHLFNAVKVDPQDLKTEFPKLMMELKALGVAVRDNGMDPFKAAAQFHERAGEVHPFWLANGRAARDWMNVLLMTGGYQPVVFKSDEEYMSHCQQGVDGFEVYLRKEYFEQLFPKEGSSSWLPQIAVTALAGVVTKLCSPFGKGQERATS